MTKDCAVLKIIALYDQLCNKVDMGSTVKKAIVNGSRDMPHTSGPRQRRLIRRWMQETRPALRR
jgi:hypothetical protein